MEYAFEEEFRLENPQLDFDSHISEPYRRWLETRLADCRQHLRVLDIATEAKRLATLSKVESIGAEQLLQQHFDKFRIAVGLLPMPLSERAKEHFKSAMVEYAKHELSRFCDYLNKYEALEDVRFDFMLIDFQNNHPHPQRGD